MELTAENVRDYLVQLGRLHPQAIATAIPLAWGVSNIVLRVDAPAYPSIVVKQSQARLRTRIDWFSRCERIYREADVLRIVASLLPVGVVPRVAFEVREDYVLGLEAIRADHTVWKQCLLDNDLQLPVAKRLGTYLGTIHRETSGKCGLLPDGWDWSLFDELRIDPFYRQIAISHPDLQSPVHSLIADMSRHRVCLVLADFSPKNVLVHRDGVSLVDFETGHYGDPAFDVGFFLSHVLLKSLRHENLNDWRRLLSAFWSSYRRTVDAGSGNLVDSTATGSRAVRHLAACLLARIDGKSPVDYLTAAWQTHLVRSLSRACLAEPPASVEHVIDRFFALRETSTAA